MPFHLITAGSVLVQGDGLPPQRLGAGDILLLPGGLPHRLSDPGSGEGRARLLCGTVFLSAPAWRLVRALLPGLLVVRAEDSSALHGLLALMRQEADSPAPQAGSAAVLGHLSAALFGLSLRQATRLPDPPPGLPRLTADARLCGVALAVLDDPAADWTLDRLADRAALSRSALIRAFTAAAGLTPADFVTRSRMAAAARLLHATADSVAAIGEAVGYASDAAFQRAFKRETGLTPAAWRALPDRAAPAPAPLRTVRS